MKVIKKLPKEICNYLESLMYETNARKDLCAFMISHGMDDTDNFRKYHNEYMEFYAKYEMAKSEMSNKYVYPEYPKCDWSVNFQSEEIEIEVSNE